MKPHTIRAVHLFDPDPLEFPFAGNLSEAKQAGRLFVNQGYVVTITTNRGTTWKLRDGRWVHDTGRKG